LSTLLRHFLLATSLAGTIASLPSRVQKATMAGSLILLVRLSLELLPPLSKSARKLFQEAYSRFLAAFREAAESLKAGDLTASFPVGSFPPGLPFVTASL
jgi:hypothetical protein